jgi:hypothetical protein
MNLAGLWESISTPPCNLGSDATRPFQLKADGHPDPLLFTTPSLAPGRHHQFYGAGPPSQYAIIANALTSA